MTTLHRVTDLTKKLLLGFTVGSVLIIFLLILISYVKSLIPKKVPPPTVDFGKVPAIQFPPNTQSGNFTYTINTLSGQLPAIPDRVSVFKVSHPGIGLLSLQQSKDLIAHNSILGEPVKLSDTQYQWQQLQSPFAKITYDIVTNNFLFTTNYLSDPIVLAAPNLPDQPGAIGSARNFFSNFSSDFSDIDLNKTHAVSYSISNRTLVPATSVSNTQAIRVDFYQNDLNSIPVYYPHFPNSLIYAIIASVNYPNLIAEGGYYHQSIQTDQSGTYPIITPDQAFKLLTANKAYIANYTGTRTNILITNMFLAYYMSDTPQDYVLPIIVFQGNDNFYAYISALTDPWISK